MKRNRETLSNPRTPRSRRGWMITLCVVLFVLGGLLITAGIYIQYFFGGLKTDDLTNDDEILGITNSAPSDSSITNLALFGIDSMGTSMVGRSDTIMILTLDSKHSKLKLTSILRDSYVPISGYGQDKIAHAYSFGGPELAINTLNSNFHLDIKEYVAVNFTSLAKAIDALGGLEITITEAERVETNRIMSTSHYSDPWSRISHSGTVKLDGIQAMSYARIRSIDSDTQRTSRQQKVMKLLLDKLLAMPTANYPALIRNMVGYVKTSLTYNEIFALSPFLMTDNLTWETNTVPTNEDNLSSGYKNQVWYWFYDLDLASARLHTFLYEDSSSGTASSEVSP